MQHYNCKNSQPRSNVHKPLDSSVIVSYLSYLTGKGQIFDKYYQTFLWQMGCFLFSFLRRFQMKPTKELAQHVTHITIKILLLMSIFWEMAQNCNRFGSSENHSSEVKNGKYILILWLSVQYSACMLLPAEPRPFRLFHFLRRQAACFYLYNLLYVYCICTFNFPMFLLLDRGSNFPKHSIVFLVTCIY